jgi:shikimate kinase
MRAEARSRPVFITGFMATGKSKIGRLLARNLDRIFLDTDEQVESRAGMPIGEIFRSQGEDAFRLLEAECVARAAATADVVVSLGGGAITRDENLQAIQAADGVLVCMEADVDTILERVNRKDDRPLLAGLESAQKRDKIEQLLAQRQPYYDRAQLKVHTGEDLDPETVAVDTAAQLRLLLTRRQAED